MADKIPIRAAYSGANALTGLATFASSETIGVAHGGTGIATAAANQLLTGNGTSALTSESNLTFDGTILKSTGDLCATVKVVSPALCIGSEYVLPTADGSAGQIMCTDGSGALAFATASAGVTLAGSTNNTIATVTGSNALAGEANLTFDGSTLTVGTSIAATADTNTSIGFPGSDVMTFSTGGTEALRINDEGVLGIKTTPLAGWHTDHGVLQIGTGAFWVDPHAEASADNMVFLSNNLYRDSADEWRYIVTDEATRYYQYGGEHYFDNAASGSAGAAISFANRLKIHSNGMLRVVGTAADPTSDNGGAGVAYFTGAASDSGIALGSYTASPWSNWMQSQQENGTIAALVVQPRGESVLFGYAGGSWANSYGTTLYNGGSAIYHVNGGVAIILRRATSYGDIMQFSHNVGGAAYVGSISVAASSTAYNTSSDYRLKENVIDLTGATTRVAQLQPHRFNFIRDPDTTVDGFVAHEVSDIVPEAITGTKDEMRNIKNVIVDADGEILEEDKAEAEWVAGKENGTYAADTVWHETLTMPKYQGIDQAKLVPLLTAAIQELTARVEALESA